MNWSQCSMSSEFRLGTACSSSPDDFLPDAAVFAVAARLARGVGAGAGAEDCVFVLLSVVTIVWVARDSTGRSRPPLKPRPPRSRFVSESERSSNSDENGRLAGSVIVSMSRLERGDRAGTGLPTCARDGNGDASGEPSRDTNGVTRLESEFEYSATYSPDTTPRALGEGKSCESSFSGSYRTYDTDRCSTSIYPNAYCPMYS